jgi:hypothetical protein
VRPVALVREPEAAAPPPGAAEEAGEESATRTAPAAPAARPGRRALAVGAAAALVTTSALLLVRGARPSGSGSGTATATAAQRGDRAGAGAGEGTPAGPPPSAPASLEPAAPVATSDPRSVAAEPSGDAPRAAEVPAPHRRSAATTIARPRPIEWVHALGRLPTPPPESGEGILSVNATPWGTVLVGGVLLGETPQEVRLQAGRHRVRIERRNQRTVEAEVTVEAGRRTKLLR